MKKIILATLLLFFAGLYAHAENCKGETVDGKKQGFWQCFYDDGTLQEEGNYTADLKTGEWKIYHANGKLAMKGTYENGVEKGQWTVYDDQGNQLDVIDYG
jgi:antitoxin component YwqK of YwqJK toxin-antitoxin module